jgi:hypothetical protein
MVRKASAERGGFGEVMQMKTKYWVLILGAVFLLLAGIVLVQRLAAKPAARAEIWVEGVLYKTLDLSEDGSLRVESERGWNEIEVRNGKISVTAASCPDADCVRCGAKNAGAPVVCLPNHVSIRFSDEGGVDGVVR